MAPSIASSSYRLPRRWRRISMTLRGRAARYWTAASYGLPGGLDLELARVTVRALSAHVEASVAHLRFDLRGDVLVLAEELLGVLAALSDALLAVVDPRTGLVEDRRREPHVEKSALARDALVREDLDLGDAERRRDLVLHDLDLHPAADHHVALLDRLDRPDVDAHGGVELQRPATRSSFGIPEHDSDLLAQLVDEDDRGLGLGDRPGELAEGLAHEPGLEPDEAVPHLAFDLFARHERRDRVDDDDVDRARAHEGIGDLERLLAVVRLRDEQVVGVDAAGPRPRRVERVLRVDEGSRAAGALSGRDRVERERGLARGLRPEGHGLDRLHHALLLELFLELVLGLLLFVLVLGLASTRRHRSLPLAPPEARGVDRA